MELRTHHLKLATALLDAVVTHSDFLDTRVILEEHGQPVLIAYRDHEANGPRVVICDKEEGQ